MMHFRNTTPLGAGPLPPTLCSHSRAATSVVRGSGGGASAPSDLIGNESRISSSGVHGNNPSDHDLQRANGSGRILLSDSGRGTRIVEVFQQSPIRILFPKTGRAAVE